MQVVREVQHTALTQHDVEIEFLAQSFIKLQCLLVDSRALIPQIVRADDSRVAAGVAAAQPALLENSHVGDAVFFRQVVCGGKTVPPATDDDHLVTLFRLGCAPCTLPPFVIAEGVAYQAANGIARCGKTRSHRGGSPYSQTLRSRPEHSLGPAPDFRHLLRAAKAEPELPRASAQSASTRQPFATYRGRTSGPASARYQRWPGRCNPPPAPTISISAPLRRPPRTSVSTCRVTSC